MREGAADSSRFAYAAALTNPDPERCWMLPLSL
jgi:hypothetical protein